MLELGPETAHDDGLQFNSAACNTTDCTAQLARELNDKFSSVLLPVTVFVGVEGVLGFFSNLLVLYVYSFRYRVCNFRFFVLFLALNDLIGCMVPIPGEIITHRYWYIYPVPLVCKIKSFFNAFTCAAPALLMLVIAVDKFLKVRLPLARQIRPKVALILCVVIVVISVACAVPIGIFWGTRSYTKLYKGTNITVTICEKDQQYADTKLPYAYSTFLTVVVSIIMFVMVLLYVAIALKMFEQQQESVSEYCDISSSQASLSEASSCIYGTHRGGVAFLSATPTNYRSNDGDIARGNFTEPEEQQHESRRPTRGHRKVRTKVTARPRQYRVLGKSVRRKTLIMFLLTAIFMGTLILFLSLGAGIAQSADILESMTNSKRATYFFFFRLYFVNHVVNPIIYGFLDTECRSVVKGLFRNQSPP